MKPNEMVLYYYGGNPANIPAALASFAKRFGRPATKMLINRDEAVEVAGVDVVLMDKDLAPKHIKVV